MASVQEIIFGIVGGLGLFIYGMNVMSDSLHKAAGERLKSILQGLTNNPIKGVIVGAIITSIVQSSSATTVMVVGFVNAGLMSLAQSLGVIFGANIGTTITAQLIAFKLTHFALPFIGFGMLLRLMSKKKSHKYSGEAILGFGMIFLGLKILTSVVKPLGEFVWFDQMLINFGQNPFLGILAGAIVTTVVQSSSVSTGMVIGLGMSGLIDLRIAIPLILGANIGTCSTAMIASVGTHIGARRAAIAHITFNILGALIFIPLIGPFHDLVVKFSGSIPRQIANAHTMFNVANTLIFLPFIGPFSKLLLKIVPGREEEEVDYLPKFLDKHLLATPPIAIEAAVKETVRTLQLTRTMVRGSLQGFMKNDPKALDRLARSEEAVDSLRAYVTNYLVELMGEELEPEDAKKIPPLLHAINDVERIGDHAENLRNLAEQKVDNKMMFSAVALQELQRMQEAIEKMFGYALDALETNQIDMAFLVFEQEKKVNRFRDLLKSNHIRRLEHGDCHVLSGIVFLDIISNLEKIGDHLTNVAQAVKDGLQ